jgi:hypothetical protein
MNLSFSSFIPPQFSSKGLTILLMPETNCHDLQSWEISDSTFEELQFLNNPRSRLIDNVGSAADDEEVMV